MIYLHISLLINFVTYVTHTVIFEFFLIVDNAVTSLYGNNFL